jgi:hypothetical protein
MLGSAYSDASAGRRADLITGPKTGVDGLIAEVKGSGAAR